jgi:SAM-dependent methyltransferase
MTPQRVEYVGKDLEAMDFALRYHSWILDLIRPYLGKNIVEVGAGTGSFSELLLQTEPERLTLIEPSAMFDVLAREFSVDHGTIDVRLFNDLFSNVAAKIHDEAPPDSIIYINVLEHIEDDSGELKLVHQTLVPGGKVILFVPALKILFSKFDRHIGHHRRYRRSELKTRCEAAGFKILTIRSFDLPGVLPWFVKFKLFGSMKVEPASVQMYDRFAVPVIRPIENILHPPIGKNLLLIAEKLAVE